MSTKQNRLRLVDCMKCWRTDRNIKTHLLPAVSKVRGEDGSQEADCHIYTGSCQKRKKKKMISIDVPYVSHAGQRAVHVADAQALTLPVNSDMCVRRWRTAGKKISCCLNKQDQRDQGVVLRRGKTRVADTSLATLRWWCCCINSELKRSR